MLRSLAFLLPLMVIGGIAKAETHPFSVHDMLAMDRISDPRVTPDGAMVAFTVRITDLDANKGRNDIWLSATDGSWARRLTTSDASDTQPRWSPDGKHLYFLSTRSGSSQVWRIALAGGEAEQVTKLPLDVDALEVTPNGAFLLFSMPVFPGSTPDETKAKLDEKAAAKATGVLYDRLFFRHWDSWSDGTRNHLFLYDLASAKARDVMREMDADCPSKPFGGSEEFDVSPDGRTVVFTAKDAGREEAWSTNFDVYAVPADGSAPPKKITASAAWDTQPKFSPDGRKLAYLAMRRAGFEADRYDVVLRDWTTGSERRITLRADESPRGDRSPSEIVWAPDGKEFFCSAAHLGQQALFAVDAASGKARILVGKGTVTSPQRAGNRILYGMHSLLGPTELFTVARTGGEPTRVTRLNDQKVAAARFGTPEQFSFKGAGGDTVHGYVVRPADFDAAKKYPVAFLIHGGPQGSFGNDFHYRWNPQAYAGRGYAVVMIDFHGSTGYGQDFTDAISGDWGGKPLEDLKLGLAFALEEYQFLDGERIGALGASYGGYMINWIAGAWPEGFKCLVCHDGNLDERMAYYDTEELWFPEWEHGGTPWDNPEGYAEHNPVDLAKNWRTPMLVIHGGKDFRVVETQGMSTFTLLQRKGIPSKFLHFPDENHWVLKPANSILWHDTVLDWLDRWLKK